MEEDVVPSAGMLGGRVDAHQSALYWKRDVACHCAIIQASAAPQPTPVIVVELAST